MAAGFTQNGLMLCTFYEQTMMNRFFTFDCVSRPGTQAREANIPWEKHGYFFAFIMLVAMAACFTGCVRLGPDFKQPEPVDAPARFEQAQGSGSKAKNGMAGYEGWWTRYGDRQLNSVVSEIVANNQDLKKAAAVLLELRAVYRQRLGDSLPSVTAQAGAERHKQNFTYNPIAGGIGASSMTTAYNLYRAGLGLSFELDLFGRLARTREAAWDNILKGKAEQEALRQALISSGVSQYVQISALSEKESLQNLVVLNAEKQVRLVKARFEQGLADFSALCAAKNSLSVARNELENIRKEITAGKQELSVLLGRYPSADFEVGHFECLVKNNPDVPPGLPSELLKRRPDIQAALFELKSANALIGAAKAARFPSISLTADLGYSSSQLSDLFQAGSLWRSIAAGITQPVFAGGKLKAGQEAARARYQQALMNYGKTILEAFRDVEKCLAVRKQLVSNICRVEKIVHRQEKELELSNRNFKGGAGDYAQVLDRSTALAKSRISFVDLQAALVLNRISLLRALGGDWLPDGD